MVLFVQKVDDIIEAVGFRHWPKDGDRAALADDLEEATETFFILCEFEESPSHAERRKDLEKIAKAACRLSERLHQAPDHISHALASQANLHAERHHSTSDMCSPKTFVVEGETFVDWEGSAALSRAADSVRLIFQWAQDAIEAQRRAAEAKKIGPLFPDEDASTRLSAEQWLIGFALPEIYERHFQTKFGISKSNSVSDRPYGPGIRFITTCLHQIDLDKSEFAIEKHWKRSRQNMGQLAQKKE